MTAREEYTAGLRALADLLDAKPELPLPTTDTIEWAVHWFDDGDREPRRVMADIARAIPGRLDKNDPNEGDYDSNYFRLTGNIGGLPIEIWSKRANVCRRVVTGVETVTEEVDACPVCSGELVDIGEGVTVCREGGHDHYRAEVPQAGQRVVTREVEKLEWVCDEPLLKALSS